MPSDPGALQAQLLAAIAAAPRPYGLPPLPADGQSALAAGTETALAFAIDAARAALALDRVPAADVENVFTQALAQLIATSLDLQAGDPAFQAVVLRADDRQVAEFAALSAAADADARAVRKAIDAFAHPGKLRLLPPGTQREALARLHLLAAAQAWSELAAAIELAGPAAASASLQAALQRLLRADALRGHASVRDYLALCARRGPLAGSEAAAAQGRASARVGDLAEQETVQAFEAIARQLDTGAGATVYSVGHGLRTPVGFPGAAGQAKDEWDVALLRHEGGAAHVVLLAEVKAAPSAAAADFSRLVRGLQRLAQAQEDAVYVFPSARGLVTLAGASLRALAPQQRALPPQVIYCCAAIEERPAVLSAASKGVLLAEPDSIAFARRLVHRESVPHEALAPVWRALAQAPRLRSVLHQYETAQAARAAMLHPRALLAAAARLAGDRKD
jgi:hypothetical protein